MRIRIGFIVNPWSGIGGPAALKGSDGAHIVEAAQKRGSEARAILRAEEFLLGLAELVGDVQVLTCKGVMGEVACLNTGVAHEVIDLQVSEPSSSAEDTVRAARSLCGRVDLLVFVGGDGTARDVLNAIDTRTLCLGVPAGVKMHSAVFGVTPTAAAEIVKRMLRGELVSERLNEVRDIDEEALRQGEVRARFYGELRVPDEGRYLQQVKCGGREDEQLTLLDIAAFLSEQADPDRLYVVGSGKTTFALKHELGVDGTLLGVDVIQENKRVATDVTESQLLELVSGHPSRLILSVIGGQGHIFGRGNQQLSPRVIRAIGLNNIQVVATRSKLKTLNGRPMLVDTGDAELNRALSGWTSVLTGYDDFVLYPVEFNG